MGQWTQIRQRAPATVGGLSLVLCLAGAAWGASLPGDLAVKLDPRLLPAALDRPDRPVSVWVAFQDKGEEGPADLARRLARAEASLDPHARARRLRAGVTPLVDYLDLPVHAPYVESLKAHGLAPYGASRWFNRVAVRTTGTRLASLARLSFVARLAPVERGVRMRDVPDLPGAHSSQARLREAGSAVSAALDYGLSADQLAQIGVPALHDSGYTGTGVRVCVLDEGFNYHDVHPALAGAAVHARRDFVDGDYDPTDVGMPFGFDHGTWTMSCIGGDQPGRYVGAAPDVTFLLGRTEDHFSEQVVEMVYWGMGAEWADSLGADIISSSVGYSEFDDPDPDYTYADLDGHTTTVSRAAEIAASKGILVVNSAGNEGSKPWHYILAPADVHGDSLIAVGAVNAAGTPASFSSYGPTADGRVKPDLAARGVSTWLVEAADTGFVQHNGTSFSCPLVAGLAACLMQARPAWSATLIVRALTQTASQAGAPDDRVGYGLPDGEEALRWIPDTSSVPELAPLSLGLRLAGPNPITAAAPRTRVEFDVGAGVGQPRLRVFDAQGRLVVADLCYGPNGSGGPDGFRWEASWDGRGSDGRLLRAGLYFVSLEAGGLRSAVRVVSLR
jgi:subtilisin family serine protease